MLVGNILLEQVAGLVLAPSEGQGDESGICPGQTLIFPTLTNKHIYGIKLTT